MDNIDKQGKKQSDFIRPYMWKKGQSGNPAGRPKGKTLKEFAREYLESLPDDEKVDYLASLPTDIVWKMAEGNPETKTDVTSGGKPIPIYGGQSINLQGHNGDQEDIPAQEAN